MKVVAKKRRLPRNSKIFTRQRVISVIGERLKKPGKISLLECWKKIVAEEKYISYSVLCVIYRDIMNEMVENGYAKRTIKNGTYEILDTDSAYEPLPVIVKEEQMPIVRVSEPEPIPDVKIELVRPAAKYGNVSREETIEKYLNMVI